ncbi:MAG: glycosyltransferase [Rhodococcus sp. (in: high G+C Gram-positive bacteria)]|uniref:glycosyltransferase n=1 Tax=Rhodococcus sp. TaxID=1831 RepID=UPI002AD90EDC|nr:glycosyltransferase [Rhodococcus sp. (in: high G+C Gram-positive bacteria)]
MSLLALAYPYILYPAILKSFPAHPVGQIPRNSRRGSEFALLFCAYNEASSIGKKIDNIRDLATAYPDLEVLAYDDCSSDGTADMLESSGLGIRVVRGTHRTGKAHGMKLLASATQREFLVFTDANVVLEVEALNHLLASYGDANVGGVCGLLEYVDSKGTPTAHVGDLYWRLEEQIKSAESRSGNVMGADGSIFSIRRVLYPEFPDTVLDDLTVSMAVVLDRYRLVKVPGVVAREQLVTSRNDDFRRRIRIATRSYHTHLWLRPKIESLPFGDRWRYWSHRQMRWYGAAFLVVAVVSGLAALSLSTSWIVGLFSGAMLAIVTAAGSSMSLGPISALVHICSSILLTGLGVLRAHRGDTVTTWKPPAR